MAISKKLSIEQMNLAKDLCQKLPLIEDELRRAGLYETATLLNKAVKKIGFETAEKSPY